MKPSTITTFRKLIKASVLIMVFVLSSLTTGFTAPVTDTNLPPMSVFDMPANPKEGRDPFFPDSTRPYLESQTKDDPQAELSSLKLQGISRNGDRVFVIINDITFGVGDDADVKADTGKIHVRCVQINNNSVVVEAGGQILTLNLPNP